MGVCSTPKLRYLSHFYCVLQSLFIYFFLVFKRKKKKSFFISNIYITHDDYNITQNNSLKNNNSELLEYDLKPPHLKDTIQNNATTSSDLNSPHLKDIIQNNTAIKFAIPSYT
jgi:hypothetical protein